MDNLENYISIVPFKIFRKILCLGNLKWSITFLILMVLFWRFSNRPIASSVDGPPNIIIILADDLGYGDLGGYFGGPSKTPHIDSLAREGMLFTDFHANGPMCSPTRASLLTGRYPQRLGVETAQRHVLDLPQNKDEITIADYMRREGHKTGIIGKWHLGRPENGNPVKFGFDEFQGFFSGEVDHFSKIDRYGNEDWWINEKLVNETGYVTQLITEKSIEFIESNKSRPFFLYISHSAIHFPWQKSDDNLWTRKKGHEYTSNFPGQFSKLGPHVPEDIPDVLSKSIEELDESVGIIITILRKYNLDQNTLVFFMSDNGGYINYNGDVWPSVGSNGQLSGQKGDVLEGGHRVPAIAWWPGHIPALSVSNQTVMTMDILPTILDLLKVKLPVLAKPNPIDGISILPLLLEGKTLEQRTLFWRIHDQKAVRCGFWKLVVQNHSVHLFNLLDDISEKKDVSDKYQAKKNELLAKLADWELKIEK